jgi:hypothetical protein
MAAVSMTVPPELEQSLDHLLERGVIRIAIPDRAQADDR